MHQGRPLVHGLILTRGTSASSAGGSGGAAHSDQGKRNGADGSDDDSDGSCSSIGSEERALMGPQHLVAGHALRAGVIEPASLATSLWTHALTIVTQLIRIDGGALAAAPDPGRGLQRLTPTGGEYGKRAAKLAARRGGRSGGSSSSGDSDSDWGDGDGSSGDEG